MSVEGITRELKVKLVGAKATLEECQEKVEIWSGIIKDLEEAIAKLEVKP